MRLALTWPARSQPSNLAALKGPCTLPWSSQYSHSTAASSALRLVPSAAPLALPAASPTPPAAAAAAATSLRPVPADASDAAVGSAPS